VVAIFRPRDCLGDVDISVTSGPVGVDVQFYLLTAFRLWATCYAERWKVERAFAWLGNFRRLLVRHERYLFTFRAFLLVALILVSLRCL
jgi:hypothetical protein